MEYMDSSHLILDDLVAEANGQPLDDGARAHLEACSNCQVELERWKAVAGGVRDLFAGMPTPSELIVPSATSDLSPPAQNASAVSRWNTQRRVIASVAAGIVVLAGAGFGVGSLLGGSKGSSSGNLSNIVLSSYSQATKSTAMLTIDVKTAKTDTTGSGAFNFQTRTGSLNLTTSEPNGVIVHTEMILSGNAAYTSMPNQPGKWIEVPLNASSSTAGSGQFQFLDPGSAKVTLQLLAQSGLGEKASTLNGQPAVEYFGSVDVSSIAKQKGVTLPASVADLPPLQISILVNKSGTAQQIKTVVNAPVGSPLHALEPITETIAFSDFGTKVSVTPPAAADVVKTISLPAGTQASGGFAGA